MANVPRPEQGTQPPPGHSTGLRGHAGRLVLGLLIITLGGAIVCWRHSPRPAPITFPSQSADVIPGPRVARKPNFVGLQACAECHRERVTDFQASRHFLACCEPAPGSMPPGFAPGQGVYATRDPSLRFEMTRRGDEFFETAVRDTPTGELRQSARIDLVYGARGITDEVFFSWVGDRLFELPIVWLHPQHQWGASPFNPHGGGDFSREMTPRCLECHNTWFEHVPGTANEYKREGSILGITCERCHGAGEKHVAYHREHPQETAARDVIHPGRLSRELQMDLCAQCHSNAILYRGPAFSYQPGEPLANYFKTVASRYPEDDHVANQVKYLRESKCFQKSDTLTCTTCHSPHLPRSQEANSGRRTCLQCHAPMDCQERERLPAAVQDNCVGCHMPARNKIQVHFRTASEAYVPPAQRWEHRIGIYPEARQEVLLEWYKSQPDGECREQAARLTQTLAEHWLTEAEARREAYRFLAAVDAYRQAYKYDHAPATRAKLDEIVALNTELDTAWFDALHQSDQRRYSEAIQTLEDILRVKPDTARIHGKLGTLYAIVGQKEQAHEHLRAVAKYDPDDPYGYAMLGWLAYLDGRFEAALEAYLQADELDPYRSKIKYEMGLVLLKLARWPEAAEQFRQALAIDPRHAGALNGWSLAERQQGQVEAAISAALRAAQLSEYRNPDILTTLAEGYASAGRLDEAAAAADKAVEAAEVSSPELVPTLRARREDFRIRAQQSAK
jgi:tetratricopeptide (TPR) repeat protein